MAKLFVDSGFGYDIRDIDFSGILKASSYTRSATSFVAQYPMGKVEFLGTNLVYDKMGAPTGGIVKSYVTWYQATKAYDVEGISVSITSIVNAAKTAGTGDDLNVIANALAGADNFKGGNGNDYIKLFGGNDVATANGGNDTIFGGTGNDSISGGDGNDWLSGDAGADKLDGGAGTDTASYATATAGITANLAKPSLNTGDAKGDVYVSIENLTGSSYADKLSGDGSANLLSGGAGDDLLIGGTGADRLNGGAGIDTASYSGATAGVTANLANAAANTGDAKGDVYVSIENLTGTNYADKLYGNAGANALSGGSGDDLLSGGAGKDILYGGLGADSLTGGAGADTFVFKALSDTKIATTGLDTIFDFSGASGDRLDLSAIDANSSASGNQAFTFVGTAAFTGKAGELNYSKQASDTYIYGDTNGDKKADFAIHLDDAVMLTKGYFIL